MPMAAAMCGLATAAGSTAEAVDRMGIIAVAPTFIQVTELVVAARAATAAAVTTAARVVVSNFASRWMATFRGSSPDRPVGTAPGSEQETEVVFKGNGRESQHPPIRRPENGERRSCRWSPVSGASGAGGRSVRNETNTHCKR